MRNRKVHPAPAGVTNETKRAFSAPDLATMETMAFERGVPTDAVLNMPENAELIERGRTRNLLNPNDKLVLPKLRRQSISRDTESRHRIEVPERKRTLRVRFTIAEESRANQPYTLALDDGTLFKGTTDDEGFIEQSIPYHECCVIVSFTTNGDTESIPLLVGGLNPVTEPSGVAQRLQNLALLSHGIGEPTEEEVLKPAIKHFQRLMGLKETGEADHDTREALSRHDRGQHKVKMRLNRFAACERTGFLPEHAECCAEVAENVDAIILFREPGVTSAGLIAENYSMKGFRIDTKSCNWGPMAGFVCVDPHLTKSYKFWEKNQGWTDEALHGGIKKEFFGDVRDPEWKAGAKPIVISQQRVKYLMNQRFISSLVSNSDGTLSGTAMYTENEKDDEGNEVPGGKVYKTTLAYRLVPTKVVSDKDSFSWLKGATDHYVVCIDANVPEPFVVCVGDDRKPYKQRYPTGVTPEVVNGYEAVLGMINPGTGARGFKACVTADYDLFATWPRENDAMIAHHRAMNRLSSESKMFQQRQETEDGVRPGAPKLAGGVARMDEVDTRLVTREADNPKQKRYKRDENDKPMNEKGKEEYDSLDEHYRYGDVSARVMHIKTRLNTALQAKGGYPGGNLIHHNDEAGNLALAKPDLKGCLPLIGFMPYGSTILIENLADFRELVLWARKNKYKVVAKEEWLTQAEVPEEAPLAANVT